MVNSVKKLSLNLVSKDKFIIRIFFFITIYLTQKTQTKVKSSPDTGLEKLGFLVNETPCSSKQGQEHVVPLAILWSLQRYDVQVFALPCTSPCTK